MQDQISAIIAYEQGELDNLQMFDLFADLIKTGLAWKLQGSYGRTAQALIDQGLIDINGNINHESIDNLLNGG